MAKKFILFVFSILVFFGCGDWAMEGLDVVSETKYIITSKKKNTSGLYYEYNIIKEGDTFYDYHYKDTSNYDVGDTLILTIKKVSNSCGNH